MFDFFLNMFQAVKEVACKGLSITSAAVATRADYFSQGTKAFMEGSFTTFVVDSIVPGVSGFAGWTAYLVKSVASCPHKSLCPASAPTEPHSSTERDWTKGKDGKCHHPNAVIIPGQVIELDSDCRRVISSRTNEELARPTRLSVPLSPYLPYHWPSFSLQYSSPSISVPTITDGDLDVRHLIIVMLLPPLLWLFSWGRTHWVTSRRARRKPTDHYKGKDSIVSTVEDSKNRLEHDESPDGPEGRTGDGSESPAQPTETAPEPQDNHHAEDIAPHGTTTNRDLEAAVPGSTSGSTDRHEEGQHSPDADPPHALSTAGAQAVVGDRSTLEDAAHSREDSSESAEPAQDQEGTPATNTYQAVLEPSGEAPPSDEVAQGANEDGREEGNAVSDSDKTSPIQLRQQMNATTSSDTLTDAKAPAEGSPAPTDDGTMTEGTENGLQSYEGGNNAPRTGTSLSQEQPRSTAISTTDSEPDTTPRDHAENESSIEETNIDRSAAGVESASDHILESIIAIGNQTSEQPDISNVALGTIDGTVVPPTTTTITVLHGPVSLDFSAEPHLLPLPISRPPSPVSTEESLEQPHGVSPGAPQTSTLKDPSGKDETRTSVEDGPDTEQELNNPAREPPCSTQLPTQTNILTAPGPILFPPMKELQATSLGPFGTSTTAADPNIRLGIFGSNSSFDFSFTTTLSNVPHLDPLPSGIQAESYGRSTSALIDPPSRVESEPSPSVEEPGPAVLPESEASLLEELTCSFGEEGLFTIATTLLVFQLTRTGPRRDALILPAPLPLVYQHIHTGSTKSQNKEGYAQPAFGNSLAESLRSCLFRIRSLDDPEEYTTPSPLAETTRTLTKEDFRLRLTAANSPAGEMQIVFSAANAVENKSKAQFRELLTRSTLPWPGFRRLELKGDWFQPPILFRLAMHMPDLLELSLIDIARYQDLLLLLNSAVLFPGLQLVQITPKADDALAGFWKCRIALAGLFESQRINSDRRTPKLRVFEEVEDIKISKVALSQPRLDAVPESDDQLVPFKQACVFYGV